MCNTWGRDMQWSLSSGEEPPRPCWFSSDWHHLPLLLPLSHTGSWMILKLLISTKSPEYLLLWNATDEQMGCLARSDLAWKWTEKESARGEGKGSACISAVRRVEGEKCFFSAESVQLYKELPGTTCVHQHQPFFFLCSLVSLRLGRCI